MSSPTAAGASWTEQDSPPATLVWHVVTGEYPPQRGGVSDYTSLLAAGLAAQGDQVHVWCPGDGSSSESRNVYVRRDLGQIRPADLRRVGEQLNRFPAPRRILVQWVPHGYGYKSMNLPLCWWLRKRAKLHGDQVQIMLHEPFLQFRMMSLRQNLAALVHRLMTLLLLDVAKRVWMSIPAWEKHWRPYALGRPIPFRWLPVPSNIPVVDDQDRIHAIRQRYAGKDDLLIGHFGTYGRPITSILEPVLLGQPHNSNRKIILMGPGSEEFRAALVEKNSDLATCMHATGALGAAELSCHVSACDILLQPYSDGVSSRRGSFMAGLSHGKPIVTNQGALSEPFWQETEAVALAPAPDADILLELLNELGADAGKRNSMGQAARELYQQRFDISHTVEALRTAEFSGDLVCAS